MNALQSNRFFKPAPARSSRTGIRLLMLAIMMLAFSGVIRAQNTKGDRPAAPSRETRFKTPFKKKKSATRSRSASGQRVKATKRSLASRASGSAPRSASGRERPGKPVRPISAPRPQDKQKAWTGDIAGYRLRHKNRSSAGDGKTNVYPQYGRYTRVKNAKPRATEHTVSNADALARLRKLESRPGPGPSKGPRVAPRSASGSFTARKSINVYANFAKPKRNTRQYNNTDLAGRPLRKKNSESPRPGVSEHRPSRFYHGRPSGERAYKGTSGGYISATRATPKAWTGDVAGRGLRRRNFSSKKSTEGIPTLGSKPRSASKGHPGGAPLIGRPPGIGASGIDAYHGNAKRVRPMKGGGSVSGRGWNNNGMPLIVRTPKQGADAALFRGRVKNGKPMTGGGSVSGRLWNNNATPIIGRAPKQGADAALFRGRIKGGKPMTGGGSVSGRVWNNNGTPIVGRAPLQGWRASEFHGNVKTHRPDKGVPNVQNSMPRPGLSAKAKKVGGFSGDIKNYKGVRGYSFQGESYTGNVKLRRKSYIQHPDAAEESIKKHGPKNRDAEGLTVRQKQPGYRHNDNTVDAALMKVKPSDADLAAGGLQVRIRQGNYGKKPHAAEGSMPGLKPTRNGQRAEELTARTKQPEYGRKPHAAEGSMPGIKPAKSSVKASEYAGGVKRNWDYIHNPSSAKEALRTREPGKAFARVAAYQGNIKMQKYALFEKNRNLHPDTKFIKPNKNNVDSERDALTNFKLWWARLFKKEETQPENLKYKGRKPRYDKGEQGLWYE